MKHFRRFLTLLIVLIIVSTISGVYNFSSIATDNKSLDINSQSISNNALTTVKTIYVNITGNDKNDGLTPKKPKKTIQNAINTAKAGDTIKIESGTYKENLKINKNIKIIGHNQKDTIIDGTQKSYCIYIDNNRKISISGFTIKNGKTTERCRWRY
ncbi:MAG: pectinesterase family protein [Methanobacterium sp.]|nr:pectinesterase family protein [Methanobacterium sp.]